MGKTSAKVKGTASKVGAALSGKVGVLNTLEGEHTEVASLMDDVLSAKRAEDQRETFQLIRQKLLIHGQGEEQGLYAECRTHEATRALADKAIQDHTEIKQLIAALDAMPPGGSGMNPWMRKFEELKASVERHVEFEENQMFPVVKDALGADMLRDLDGRYTAYRKRVEAHGEQLDPRTSRTG